MKRILVWDIPTRLFHWLLAVSFFVAFVAAQFFDDESATFAVHMLLGLVMVFMIILRVIWGFTGTKYARFSSFLYGPVAVVQYFRDVLKGRDKDTIGHNPAASWAAYLMLLLPLGLAATGLLMAQGGELYEEIHEILAYVMLAVVAGHILGVIVHSYRHKENITRSMIDGKKKGQPAQAIPSARPLVGLLFVVLTGAWTGTLFKNYNASTQQVTLPWTGPTLQLGEAEGEGERGEGEREHEEREEGEEHED